jgi:glucokinase
MQLRIITGDIGGTHARLQIVTCDGEDCRVQRSEQYASQSYPDFDAILRVFLETELPGTISVACLAIAGPVQSTTNGQRVQVTNLPWVLDSAALADAFAIPHVVLINDFQAVGHGLGALPEASFAVLQEGKPVQNGTRAVIGAGTGLGQAILLPRPTGMEVLATEGGHVDFGPTTELELELARWLMSNQGRACYEDVLSGPGLFRLYTFLRARRPEDESATLALAIQREDPAAAITQAALQHQDALATATLNLFVHIYGAQAGNLALAVGAAGGIDLAGGIAPRIIARLRTPIFLEAFLSKGSQSHWLAAVPVRVVMDPGAGLHGALVVARKLVMREFR